MTRELTQIPRLPDASLSRRSLLGGSAAVVAGATLLPLVPEAQAATSVRYASHEYLHQLQENWCAPASARIALTAQDRGVSQRQLAIELGVSLNSSGNGLPDINNLPRVLNKRLGGNFYQVRSRSKASDYRRELDKDVTRCVNAGFVVIINTLRLTKGHTHSKSKGHYLTIAGYKPGYYLLADPYKPDNRLDNAGSGVWWPKETVWGWNKLGRWVGAWNIPSANNWPSVEKGSNGYRVSTIQYLLRARGHRITVDGDFGNRTKDVVKAFQKGKRLTQDGVVGPVTWGKLVVTVRKGSKGSAVQAVQKAMTAVGLNLSRDGDFGSGTDKKVKNFQKIMGLTQDGVVGPTTWSYLV